MYEAVAQQFGITIDPALQKQINEGLLCDWRSMVQKNVVSRQIAARKGRPSGWPDLTSQKVLLEASQNVLLGDPNMYMGNPMQTANQALPAQPVANDVVIEFIKEQRAFNTKVGTALKF